MSDRYAYIYIYIYIYNIFIYLFTYLFMPGNIRSADILIKL